jgi:flavoprotein
MIGQVADLCEVCEAEGACLKATLARDNGMVLGSVKLCDGCAQIRGFQAFLQTDQVAQHPNWAVGF